LDTISSSCTPLQGTEQQVINALGLSVGDKMMYTVKTPEFELIIFEGSHSLDLLNDNVDVEVKLLDGSRYAATFFTLENIQQILHRYKKTGECRGGLYLWASDMIVTEKLSRDIILESVVDLLKNGELSHAFSRIEGDS